VKKLLLVLMLGYLALGLTNLVLAGTSKSTQPDAVEGWNRELQAAIKTSRQLDEQTVEVTIDGFALYEGRPVYEAYVRIERSWPHIETFGRTITSQNGYFFLKVNLPEESAGENYNIFIYLHAVPNPTGMPILYRILSFTFDLENTHYSLGETTLWPFLDSRAIIVYGKIVGGENANSPIAGANITLRDEAGQVISQTVSGLDGIYQLAANGSDLPPEAELTLTVIKNKTVSEEIVAINDQQHVYHKDIQLSGSYLP
jgi:hypothetical protein